MGELMDMYERERAERKRRRELGLPLDKPMVQRHHTIAASTSQGIDYSIPESERRDREPGEEG
jgi:hypothetical protein